MQGCFASCRLRVYEKTQVSAANTRWLDVEEAASILLLFAAFFIDQRTINLKGQSWRGRPSDGAGHRAQNLRIKWMSDSSGNISIVSKGF
jgi:hypothetical protein